MNNRLSLIRGRFPLLSIWWLACILSGGCAGSQDKDVNADANQNVDTSTDTSTTESDSTGNPQAGDSAEPGTKTVRVDLESTAKPAIVYVIWIENKAGTFVQNLYVCGRLLDNSLSGIPLPYWTMNKKDDTSIDGLSGATVLPEFSISRVLSPEAGRQFTVYAEVDHSFDNNDWFRNQPAVLFGVEVDLDTLKPQYEMAPLGWTKGSQNKYRSIPGAPTSADGELNTELRYLDNHADNGAFGAADPASATLIIDELTVVIN